MSQVIIEKLDAIQASTIAKTEEISAQAKEAIEAAKAEFAEKVAALEAKVASVQAPAVIREQAKTVQHDVNRMVKEQLADFSKQTRMLEKEIKLFEIGRAHV